MKKENVLETIVERFIETKGNSDYLYSFSSIDLLDSMNEFLECTNKFYLRLYKFLLLQRER